MLEHVHLHLCAAELVKRRHDSQLDLAEVKFTLLLFVLVVAESINVRFKQLFEPVIGNFGITIFIGTHEQGHGIRLFALLNLFSLL